MKTKNKKISKKTAAVLGLAAVVVLTALWFRFRSAPENEDPVTFDRLPGLSGTPTFTVAELIRLRAGEEPLVLSTLTSERDPALCGKIEEILSSYGFMTDDPDSVSADAVRIRFAFGESKAAALEIRSDSSVTLFGTGESVSYRAVSREGVSEALYTALSRLFTEQSAD